MMPLHFHYFFQCAIYVAEMGFTANYTNNDDLDPDPDFLGCYCAGWEL